MARGRLRAKLPQLRRALEGRFGPDHALIVGEILAKLDYLDEMTGRLSEEVDRHIAPFGAEVELLTTVTRVGQRTAECLVAEIGVDMARFGSAAVLPPGRVPAPATTSRQASPAQGALARAPSGSQPCWPRPPKPPGTLKALTSAPSSRTPDAVRTIADVTTIRDRVLAPLLGEVRRPRRVANPTSWTVVEHDCEKLRTAMESLFGHLGIAIAA